MCLPAHSPRPPPPCSGTAVGWGSREFCFRRFSSPVLKPALCTELWDLMQHKELSKLFSTSKTSSIFSLLLSETGSGWILAGQVQLLLRAPLQLTVNSGLCWKCNELSIGSAWCTPRPAPSCSAAPPRLALSVPSVPPCPCAFPEHCWAVTCMAMTEAPLVSGSSEFWGL